MKTIFRFFVVAAVLLTVAANANGQKKTKLPAEFTVTIDFSKGWPFEEACAPKWEQKKSGEKYTYQYEYKKGKKTLTQMMDFYITRGAFKTDKSYSFIGRELFFDSEGHNSTAMIGLPAFKGRYIKEIRAVHSSSSKRFNINYGFPVVGPNKTGKYVRPGVESVHVLPFESGDGTLVEAEDGQIYSVRMRDIDMKVSRITIVYTSVKPE